MPEICTISAASATWQAVPVRGTVWRENVCLGAVGALLLGATTVITGRIDAEGGAGWDGLLYVNALQGNLGAVTHNVLMRPAVILLNVPAYRWLGDGIAAFAAMNYFYAFALAMSACHLYDRYSTDRAGKRWLVANLFLCISVSRVFAFYPTLIDLGASALLMLGTLAVLQGPRWLRLVATVVGVLAREFGVCLAIFGFIREVRTTRRVEPALLTYLPAVVVFVGMRVAVSRYMPGLIDRDTTLLLQAAENVGNPVFVLLCAYFLLTVFGGISLAVVVAGRRAWALIRREIEWVAFLAAVIPVTLLTHDIWRYLMFLAPAVVAMFATVWEATPRLRRPALGIAITAATLLSQRPWDPIDEFVYFRDWFPFYSELRLLPSDIAIDVWPLWAWRVVFVAVATWALVEASFAREHTTTGAPVLRRDGSIWTAFALVLGSAVLQWTAHPTVLDFALAAIALVVAGWQLTGSGWGIAVAVGFAWLINPPVQDWRVLTAAAAGLPFIPWYLERPEHTRTAAFAAFTLLVAFVSPPVAVIFGVSLLAVAVVVRRAWAPLRIAAVTIGLVAAIATYGMWRNGVAAGESVWRSGDVVVVNPPSVAPRVANVRWDPSVDPVTRAALERSYGVEPTGPRDGVTWHYRFAAASRIADILADPRVEDTFYFERLDWRWRLSGLFGAASLSRLEPGPGVDLGALARVFLQSAVWFVPVGIALVTFAAGVATAPESTRLAFLMAMALVGSVGALTLGNPGAPSSWAVPIVVVAMTGGAVGLPIARRGEARRHQLIRAAFAVFLIVGGGLAALAGQFAEKVQ